jgi:hypothetical protein
MMSATGFFYKLSFKMNKYRCATSLVAAEDFAAAGQRISTIASCARGISGAFVPDDLGTRQATAQVIMHVSLKDHQTHH